MSRRSNWSDFLEGLRDFLSFSFKFMACLGVLFVVGVLILAAIGRFVFGI